MSLKMIFCDSYKDFNVVFHRVAFRDVKADKTYEAAFSVPMDCPVSDYVRCLRDAADKIEADTNS